MPLLTLSGTASYSAPSPWWFSSADEVPPCDFASGSRFRGFTPLFCTSQLLDSYRDFAASDNLGSIPRLLPLPFFARHGHRISRFDDVAPLLPPKAGS